MKITYISGTRADYELMRSVLERLHGDRLFDFKILVTGMHLRKEFGETVKVIERDGFPILAKIDTLHSKDSNMEMTVSLGHTIAQMAKVLENEKPDFILLLGDRDEQLAGAICGSHLNILLGHVHGGERSGSIDESNRHAITRFSHLHLASCQESFDRLSRMGEESWRIHLVGAPALDRLSKMKKLSRMELSQALKTDYLLNPYLVLLQHSVTTEAQDTKKQIEETLVAIQNAGLNCIALVPNADAGGKMIRHALEEAHNRGELQLFVHLEQEVYGSLLAHSEALIGNSSSGIIEAPFLNVPVVNIGSRQNLRFRGSNVIDVEYDRNEILKAIKQIVEDPHFRKKTQKDQFIYGDGHASEKILSVLKTIDHRNPSLLQKRITF